MRNNEQKIIRGIELNSRKKNGILENDIDYIESKKHIYERFISDSELLRIMEAIDSENVEIRNVHGENIKYLPGILFVKVNHNFDKYEKMKEADGVVVLNHKDFVLDESGKNPKLDIVYTDECKEKPVREQFKRLMVGAGHSRSKKALFIREDLFDKAYKILLGGIDEYAEINGYPNYKKGYAKWNSYFALPSTDSIAVKAVPNIIVIDDFKRENVSDTFDMVYQHKSINPEWQDGQNLKYKYKKTYEVKRGKERTDVVIMPFDGAGLVSVQCAARWSLELNIRNSKRKRYIPSNFQFRMIPGFKGNVYTFDIKEFRQEYGDIITDIKGNLHDLTKERVDLILTKSQAKFLDMFDNDIEKWKKIFEQPVIFYKKDENGIDTKEVECQYQRTFNISNYADDMCDIKRTTQSAYQHLQTVCFTDDEIQSYTHRTVEKIKKSTENIDGFLEYRGCTEEKRKENPDEWKRIPPYYRAAFSMPEEYRDILFSDKYFESKVKDDIDGMINRALSGKEEIDGNYQTFVPDIYALAQYAFGKRGDEVTGLLKSEEVYSNWWMHWKDEDGNVAPPNELALIRNPHIFMEARIVKLLHDKTKVEYNTFDDIVKFVERKNEVNKWFKYQKTGIITDSYSTIPLALSTADFDGDSIVSTNSPEYISAVKRAREKGNGNTVDYKIIESDDVKADKKEMIIDVSDVRKLMESDVLAYLNNIGTVIERVTSLWGTVEEDVRDDKIMEYIAIADIIGQLTIDAAKTGEFEEFYPEISIYMKNIVALEPYFKKYLSKKSVKAKAEKKAVKNANIFYPGNSEVIQLQKKFSEFKSNMNRICWHMEKQIDSIKDDLDKGSFDYERFKAVFIDGNVNENSELFKRIKSKLIELSNKHHEIFESHVDDDSEEKDDSVKHYRWFYANARNVLLSECKLSEEKSINKVLNIIVTLCYEDDGIRDNDNAKSIMWNCFADEMISRASGDKREIEFDWKSLPQKTRKTQKLNKKIFDKKPSNPKKLVLKELDEKSVKNPIIILDKDLRYIRKKIKSSSVIDDKSIGADRALLLRRLFSVLMVISKRCEKDIEVNREDGTTSKYHRMNEVRIHQDANGKLNISALAKLAGFTDYQRKKIYPDMLLQLQKLGMIQVNCKDMERLRLKVFYDNYGTAEESESLIEQSIVNAYSYDYEKICKELRSKFRK